MMISRKYVFVFAALLLAAEAIAAPRTLQNDPQVTIAFDGFPYKSTACDPPLFVVGSSYTLPDYRPQKDGKTLYAWAYNEQNYLPGATFTVPETDVLFTPVWNAPSALDPVIADPAHPAPAVKILRNGQLLILRDGTLYNAQGNTLPQLNL